MVYQDEYNTHRSFLLKICKTWCCCLLKILPSTAELSRGVGEVARSGMFCEQKYNYEPILINPLKWYSLAFGFDSSMDMSVVIIGVISTSVGDVNASFISSSVRIYAVSMHDAVFEWIYDWRKGRCFRWQIISVSPFFDSHTF